MSPPLFVSPESIFQLALAAVFGLKFWQKLATMRPGSPGTRFYLLWNTSADVRESQLSGQLSPQTRAYSTADPTRDS